MDESNSNIEQAAKVVPGLGLIYNAGQTERDLEASRQLAAGLPPWQPGPLFESSLREELAKVALPGRLLSAAETGVSESILASLNSAGDIVDWQRRYFLPQPDRAGTPPSRAYSMSPELRESLVLEVNLGYGAPSDGKGQWTPTVTAVARLVRGSDNGALWRHEERLDDKSAMRPSRAYLAQPAELEARLQALLPSLARGVASALERSIREASAPPPPIGAPPSTTPGTLQASPSH